jgi:hypothetical protein
MEVDLKIECPCGCNNFWFFGEYVRCQQCLTEIKWTNQPNSKYQLLWFRKKYLDGNYSEFWEKLENV